MRLFDLFDKTGILPYAGGWMQQPAWFVDDVEKILLLTEYEELNQSLPKAPPMQGVPINGRK